MSFSLDRQEFSAMIRQARSALLSLNRAANQELAASAVESAADGPSVELERHRSRIISVNPGLSALTEFFLVFISVITVSGSIGQVTLV